MLDAAQTKDIILDQYCRAGPVPDFGTFPSSLYFVPTHAYAKNRDSAHPYNFVRRLFRGWLDDPVMLAHIPDFIRDFFFRAQGYECDGLPSGVTVADEEDRAGPPLGRAVSL
jgi:hypothetical protein